jgi:hypothetical protein
MTERRPGQPHWIDRLAGTLAQGDKPRVSRRLLGTAGALAVAGLTSAVHRKDPARAMLAAETDSILGDAATAEGLLVTMLGVARTKQSQLALDEATVRLVRAAQCEEEAHFNNLVAAGAVPSTSKYTIADRVFENPTTFLTTWLDLERIMVGMYMIAARRLAENGEPNLVEMAYQIGAVEAQHQALLRQLMGERLPADRAFAAWQFRQTTQGLAEIKRMGLIDGDGTTYDYPGPGDRFCRGVTGLVAETTADQTPPDVTPAPRQEATPQASPVSTS